MKLRSNRSLACDLGRLLVLINFLGRARFSRAAAYVLIYRLR